MEIVPIYFSLFRCGENDSRQQGAYLFNRAFGALFSCQQAKKVSMSLSSKTLANHAAAKVRGKVLFFLRLYFKSPISPPPVDDTEEKGGGDRKSRRGGVGGRTRVRDSLVIRRGREEQGGREERLIPAQTNSDQERKGRGGKKGCCSDGRKSFSPPVPPPSTLHAMASTELTAEEGEGRFSTIPALTKGLGGEPPSGWAPFGEFDSPRGAAGRHK